MRARRTKAANAERRAVGASLIDAGNAMHCLAGTHIGRRYGLAWESAVKAFEGLPR